MRITGRQLRQIIKEEVESMMSEEGGVEISGRMSGSSHDQGNIREADGGDPATMLQGKLTTDPAFKESVRRSIERTLDRIFRSGKMAPGGGGTLGSLGDHTVNMVTKVTDQGLITELVSLAIDGSKFDDVSWFPQTKTGATPVAFLDLPTKVKIGYINQGVMGVAEYSTTGIKFRNLPKKA